MNENKEKKNKEKTKKKKRVHWSFCCEDLHGDADDAFNTVPNMAQ